MGYLLKPDEFEVVEDDPWLNDKIERKKVATYLTPILTSIRQPFVIALESEYGTGKTTFLKCWRQDLVNQGYCVVYHNAWATDFADDAAASVLSAISRGIIEIGNEEFRKRAREVSKSVGALISKLPYRQLLPLVLKGIVLNQLDEETAAEIKSKLGLGIDDLANAGADMLSDRLDSFDAQCESMGEFKHGLESQVENLTRNEEDEGKRKIIVFTDELDRCRPDYAINVLETLKHLYSVPGLVFLLTVDRSYLESAVSASFGSKAGSEDYLRKFVDWRFRFPEQDSSEFVATIVERFDFANAKGFNLNQKEEFGSLSEFVSVFRILANGFGLSLRQQEQALIEVGVVVRSVDERSSVYSVWLAIAVVIKCARPNWFDAITNGDDPSVEKTIREYKEETEGFYSLTQVYVFEHHMSYFLRGLLVRDHVDNRPSWLNNLNWAKELTSEFLERPRAIRYLPEECYLQICGRRLLTAGMYLPT